MPLRVLLVDDSAGFLETARAFLETDGILVVGVATTGAEALEHVQELRPEVALIDIDLGEESGFALTQRIDADEPSGAPQVILISSHAEEDFEELIGRSPAIGFLSKSDFSAEAIRQVLRDGHADGRPAGGKES